MKETASIREMAYEALLAVDRDGRQSHLVIHGSAGDAFFRRLVTGTLEQRLLLDYVIDCFARTKTAKMRPGIREILRMAVYQMLFMDSVPDRAAVDEAVKLAQKKGFGSLRGFVNGVLRTIQREKDRIKWPDPVQEPLRAVSVRYSVPEETVRSWTETYGQEKAERICAAFAGERPPAVHVFSAEEEEEALLPSGILPDAYFLAPGTDPAALAAFRDGRLYVQDLSSQIAMAAVEIGPSDRILDLCAAPGGKSLLAAARARSGSVLSRDLTEKKTALIRENMTRCHVENVQIKTADACVFAPELAEAFDLVIADLPCSGFGVAGRKPEIRYKPYRETTAALAALQRQILTHAVRYVRPGGLLLYSTCTIAREENEENAHWLREQYALEPLPPSAQVRQLLDVRGIPYGPNGVQLLPCDGPWDGFFFALFRRSTQQNG